MGYEGWSLIIGPVSGIAAGILTHRIKTNNIEVEYSTAKQAQRIFDNLEYMHMGGNYGSNYGDLFYASSPQQALDIIRAMESEWTQAQYPLKGTRYDAPSLKEELDTVSRRIEEYTDGWTLNNRDWYSWLYGGGNNVNASELRQVFGTIEDSHSKAYDYTKRIDGDNASDPIWIGLLSSVIVTAVLYACLSYFGKWLDMRRHRKNIEGKLNRLGQM